MKKFILLSTFAFGMFLTSAVNAQACGAGGCAPARAPACAPAQAPACAPAACAPADQSTGECWCLNVHYEPNYYCTPRCVEEKIPCTKKCCRQVTKYYDVQRCRYVPEYYTETYSYQEPEYYDVPDCKTVYRTEYDQHVEYVPSYYWKHSCGQTVPCNSGCGR